MAELRYSDKDLKEFEGLIHEKLASAREDLDQLQRSLSHRDDNSTEELWFLEGNKPVTNHWSTPLVKDGYLYGMFGFKEYGDGPLKCVELKTGKVMWEKSGYGPAGVCLAGDILVCLGDRGQLTLVNASPDKYEELSRLDRVVKGKCWSSPIFADNKILIRSTEEAVCLDLK